jgi:16S rRNA C967 or C1407 C5-methylase (RsmB/RsmF family)
MENLNEEDKTENKKEGNEIKVKNEKKENNLSSNNKKKKKKPKKAKEPKKSKLSQEEIESFREKDSIINESFISYYKNILNFSEEEFSKFLKISVQDLPIIFRINKIYTFSESLEEEITELLIKENEHFSNRIKRPKLNFLDNIYQIDKLDKNNKIDNTLKEILFQENDYGILRQELVSMVPVNLVDIDENDIILDMCAAPGNKTIQALEIMEEKARSKSILPSGVIIANELDPKRAGNMAHFFKAHFPINIVVTNNNAEKLPIIEDDNYKPNIVICDVPCSGDGTLRKNKFVRKKWKIEFGLEDHFIQTKILDNAIRQCKKDGYIIYSTCAINPLEDEAVVCHIMEQYKDEIEIINCGKKLREMGIKFREGLIKWKVCVGIDKDNKFIWEEKFENVKDTKNGLIKESMFHDIYTYKNNHPGALFSFTDPFNLRNCIRIYSHDNDSDCFFIAVIHKKKDFGKKTPFNNKNDYSIPLNEKRMKTIGDDLDDFIDFLGLEKDENENKKNDNKKDFNVIKDNKDEGLIFTKYVNIEKYKDSFNDLMQVYKFKNNLVLKHLFCKRDSSHKIFLFSQKLSEMITIFTKMNINIIRSGLVVFKKEREKAIKMKYRVTHYGAILMADYFGGQIIELDRPDLLKLLFESEDLSIPLGKIPEKEKEKTNDNKNKAEEELIFKKYVNLSKYTDSYNDLMRVFKFKNGLVIRHLFCKRESSQKIFLFSKKLSEMIIIFTKMNINIIRSGLVVFKKEREKAIKMKYRITHYGAILMADYLGAQIIELDRPDLLKSIFDTDDLSISLEKIPEEETKKLNESENGSVILLYDAFILVARKGKGTLHLMTPKFPKGTLKKYFLRAISDE